MNAFEVMLLNITLIGCPLLIYFIWWILENKIDYFKNECVFTLTIISCFYMTYRLGINYYPLLPFLNLSIVVLLAYLNDSVLISSLLMTALLIIFGNYNLGIMLQALPYIVLLVCRHFLKKQKAPIYCLITIFVSLNVLCFAIWLYCCNVDMLHLIPKKEIIYNVIIYVILSYLLGILFYKYKSEIIKKINYDSIKKEEDIYKSLFKITHEIKNPIAVCKGYLEMFDSKDTVKSEKYINIISSEIDRVLVLLQDFLLINRTKVSFEIMDINFLLEDIVQKMEPIFKENNIKLINNIALDELYINGDYNRLSQVIVNILKNSVEALDKNNACISVTSKKQRNKVVLIIEDNGQGISKNDMKNIRKPFYTTKSQGSGLGVPLIYEIVLAHNGNVKYRSKEGIGTKVIIELPLNLDFV